ncbi:Uncharacterised protein [Serratia marcescens]|nr:Uncharacterised protein [Serratia marcescens]
MMYTPKWNGDISYDLVICQKKKWMSVDQVVSGLAVSIPLNLTIHF